MAFNGFIVVNFAIIYFCMLYSFECITAQTCPAPNQEGINLMKLVKLVTYDLGTCDVVDDITSWLTSYMDSCEFVTQADAVTFSQCSGICRNVSSNCRAFFMSRDGGCEVCLATTSGTGGNGNEYNVNKIMVRAEYLRDFINCEASFYLHINATMRQTCPIVYGCTKGSDPDPD